MAVSALIVMVFGFVLPLVPTVQPLKWFATPGVAVSTTVSFSENSPAGHPAAELDFDHVTTPLPTTVTISVFAVETSWMLRVSTMTGLAPIAAASGDDGATRPYVAKYG